jgi:hypothetical protein
MTQDGRASTEGSDNDATDCVFGIGNMSKGVIANIKFTSPRRQISQAETGSGTRSASSQDFPIQRTSFIGVTRMLDLA